jgi:peptide/nickel transport system substrate-binding protein
MSRRSFGLGAAGTLGAMGLTGALAGCGNLETQGGGDSNSSDGGGDLSLLVGMDNGSPTFDKNFNPYSSTKRTGATVIYEPLFVLNSITGEFAPFLGESFEFTDPSTIEVTLRSGVTWSDGEDFTADDVEYTFTLLKEESALDTGGVWGHLKSLETSDDGTVVFHLTEEDVPAATIILPTLIVPKHLWDPVEEPVGPGPYTLGDYTPNQYTMVKNDSYYFADKVVPTSLILPASNEQLDLVNKGYDWAYAYISDVENTWVDAGEGNIYWFPPGGTISMFPMLDQAPFDDVNFRQGVAVALDRSKIADVAAEGTMAAAGNTGLLLPNQEAWLDPSIADGGEATQDTDAAMTYFEKAGYTMSGEKLVDDSGKQVSITIMTPNSYTDWLRGAQEIQRELQALGMKVELNQPQPAGYQQSLQNGDFQVAMASFGGNGDIYSTYNNLMGQEFAKPAGESTTANYGRYSNDEAQSLIDVLRTSPDEAEQKEAAYGLQKIFGEDMPVIPIWYGGLWGLFSEKKFTGWPSEDNPYAAPMTWTSNNLLILTTITAA